MLFSITNSQYSVTCLLVSVMDLCGSFFCLIEEEHLYIAISRITSPEPGRSSKQSSIYDTQQMNQPLDIFCNISCKYGIGSYQEVLKVASHCKTGRQTQRYIHTPL